MHIFHLVSWCGILKCQQAFMATLSTHTLRVPLEFQKLFFSVHSMESWQNTEHYYIWGKSGALHADVNASLEFSTITTCNLWILLSYLFPAMLSNSEYFPVQIWMLRMSAFIPYPHNAWQLMDTKHVWPLPHSYLHPCFIVWGSYEARRLLNIDHQKTLIWI